MGVTRNLIGSTGSDDASSTLSSDLFHQRFRYFLAKNKPNKEFIINAVGCSALSDIDDYNNHVSPANHNEYIIPQPQADDSTAAIGVEAILPYMQDNDTVGTRRRYSASSTDSGFQSSPDETALKCNMYFDNFEDIDPFLACRPGNPLSTILDGRRGKAQSCRAEAQQQYINTINGRPPSDVDILDFFQDNNATIHSVTSTSSEDSSYSTHSVQSSLYSVSVKTDSRGFMAGEIVVPHSQMCAWANERDHCDTRVIHLESNASTFKPNLGLVTLVEPIGISIISDIDDTIKDTQILAGAKTVLSNTFFKDCRQVPGMAEAYMRWYSQGASFHYVSNSPFQLMPMLQGFLKKYDFPPGSMHLRADGSLLARLVEVPGQAKRDAIIRILLDFPKRKFILIGDSGEMDLEIYARIAADFDSRIIKILIRDVSTKCSSSSVTTASTRLVRRSTSFFLKKQPQQQSAAHRSFSDPLQVRLWKARQMCKTEIVVFESADKLKDDEDIRDALWQSWDEQ
ncbi:hypothetical protein BX666DRAFT_1922833 [Dichotomocladium elegans]|nr:hypothetical protein BX666DRAFT_1922833 [Dichotomocladium elegans]